MLQHFFKQKIARKRILSLKNVAFLSFLILIGMAVFVACQKDLKEIVAQPSSEQSLTKNTSASPVNSRTGGAKIKVSCKGTCGEGETANGCEGMLYDGNAGTLECPCTGCLMTFTKDEERITASSPDAINAVNYSRFFKEYLQDHFNTTTAVVYSLEIDHYENAETASFEFKSPVNNQRESVMYITPIGPNGQKGGPVVEVDCTGSCATPEETCRERYNLSTGTAECTCEGDCKMTVQYKDQN